MGRCSRNGGCKGFYTKQSLSQLVGVRTLGTRYRVSGSEHPSHVRVSPRQKGVAEVVFGGIVKPWRRCVVPATLFKPQVREPWIAASTLLITCFFYLRPVLDMASELFSSHRRRENTLHAHCPFAPTHSLGNICWQLCPRIL